MNRTLNHGAAVPGVLPILFGLLAARPNGRSNT